MNVEGRVRGHSPEMEDPGLKNDPERTDRSLPFERLAEEYDA
ncbi:MAG: hypothetical protein SWK76_00445 [Actinomycetota bacterium]|nr:hypothetical protein [Actinomycetota bacterium]